MTRLETPPAAARRRLSDADIMTCRAMPRRAAFALGAAAALAWATPAQADAGFNDGDRGASADPRGAGRAGAALGANDGDEGPNEDPAGRGRGNRHATGRNDTDRNQMRGGDPPGQGR